MKYTESEIENIKTFFDNKKVGSKIVFYNGDDANYSSCENDFSLTFTERGALVINESRELFERYSEVGFGGDLLTIAGYNEGETPEYFLLDLYGVDEVEFLED